VTQGGYGINSEDALEKAHPKGKKKKKSYEGMKSGDARNG